MLNDGVTKSDCSLPLERLRQAQRRYRALLRRTAVDTDYVDPEEFSARLLDGFQLLDGFFEHAIKAEPKLGLAWVVAALWSERQGDLPGANRRARRAISLDSHDLVAQRIHDRTASPVNAEPDLRGRYCKEPFENAVFGEDGKVHFCCLAWQPVTIGNINQQSADEIWNSPRAQEIRKTIHDGTFRYCSRMHCPVLAKLPRKEDVTDRHHRDLIENATTRLPQGPQKVHLAHDRSCNLSCPSCRVSLIAAKKHEVERLNRVAEEVVLPLARNARSLRATGSGDPFGSAHFRYILKRINRREFPKLKIDLQTNGLLLDRQAWDDLELEGLINSVYVSIDAADPLTYRVLRRGGELSRLLANFKFIAELRAKGSVRHVRLDVVLQAMNFQELPAIVAIARAHKFDSVKCQMIRNWGTFTPAEFANHNIGSPNHPDYGRLVDLLTMPQLQDGFVQFWGMEMALKAARERTNQINAALPGLARADAKGNDARSAQVLSAVRVDPSSPRYAPVLPSRARP